MHGNLTGAYDIRHVTVRNRVVLTNKTPTGLNRGFGGPQMYYALERLMQRVAVELKLDPIDVIRRNLVTAKAFPYRTASGTLLDSGDYSHALDVALADGGFDELKKRRDAARAQGRIYGIGSTAVVEPSVSNMGYITTVLTAEERRRAGAQERRTGDGHRRFRSAWRGQRPHRFGTARARPPHRAGTNCCRCVWACSE